MPIPPSTRQPVVKWLVDESQIEYPSEDGLPMAESDHQRIPLTYGVESLDVHFKSDPNIYVSGNLLIYPERGNPYESVAPDLFVVFGIEDRKRDSYKLWEEKVPAFVLEILSPSTATKDQGSKQGMYNFWGVKEYFMYDPKMAHLEPPLKGLRLSADGSYKPIAFDTLADGTVSIYSETLALDAHVFPNGELRFYDPSEQRYLPNYAEARQIAREANERADASDLAAEEARQRAEQAYQQVEQERQRVAKLHAKLRELGIDPDSI